MFRIGMIVMGVCVVVALSGCGIKPGSLTPPSGKDAPVFPAPYPRASS